MGRATNWWFTAFAVAVVGLGGFCGSGRLLLSLLGSAVATNVEMEQDAREAAAILDGMSSRDRMALTERCTEEAFGCDDFYACAEVWKEQEKLPIAQQKANQHPIVTCVIRRGPRAASASARPDVAPPPGGEPEAGSAPMSPLMAAGAVGGFVVLAGLAGAVWLMRGEGEA